MNKIIIIIILLFLGIPLSMNSQSRIKMKKEGGVYTVPCEVNGLKLRFIFDTGASNVCISITEVLFMLKNDYLDIEDIRGTSKAQIADGSIVENTEIILREIKIGNKKLTNVKAVAMHNIAAPLLLGQSAIELLGTIKLDGDELVIVTPRKKKTTTTNTAKSNSTSTTKTASKSTAGKTENKKDEAKKWLVKADEFYGKNMYEKAAEAFKKAYIADPKTFTAPDFLMMAYSLSKIGDIRNAPLYFSKAKEEYYKIKDEYIKKTSKDNWASTVGMTNGMEIAAYIENGMPDRAISKGKVAIDEYNNKLGSISGKYRIYGLMSSAYVQKEDYKKAIDALSFETKFYVMEKFGNNVSLSDLEKKGVKDERIGKSFYYRALYYNQLKDNKNYIEYLQKASLFGNKDAVNTLKSLNNAGSKTLTQRNNQTSTDTKKRSSMPNTKRYTVKSLTIDVFDNSDWKVDFKQSDNITYLTASSTKELCTIVIGVVGEIISVDEAADLILETLKEAGTTITRGKRKNSRFGIPGGIEFSYKISNKQELRGLVNIFNKDGSVYMILTMELPDSDPHEMTKIFNSIQL